MKPKSTAATKSSEPAVPRASAPRPKAKPQTASPAKPTPEKTARSDQGLAPVEKASVEKTSDAAKTKLSTVIAMLRMRQGASLDDLVKATGWQKHSVRGAISGAIKKKMGLKIEAVRGDDGTTYRIVG